MGNSPSFGLGVRETHSSRDVRLRDPEKEVERSRASRAPTHNEYVELPASSKPHSTIIIIIIIIISSVKTVNLNSFTVGFKAKHVATRQFVGLNHCLEVSNMVHVFVHICCQYLQATQYTRCTQHSALPQVNVFVVSLVSAILRIFCVKESGRTPETTAAIDWVQLVSD